MEIFLLLLLKFLMLLFLLARKFLTLLLLATELKGTRPGNEKFDENIFPKKEIFYFLFFIFLNFMLEIFAFAH